MDSLWSFPEGRYTVERRGPFWCAVVQKPNQRWPGIAGVFSTKEKAQADIEGRYAWKRELKRRWEGA